MARSSDQFTSLVETLSLAPRSSVTLPLTAAALSGVPPFPVSRDLPVSRRRPVVECPSPPGGTGQAPPHPPLTSEGRLAARFPIGLSAGQGLGKVLKGERRQRVRSLAADFTRDRSRRSSGRQ
ncbi:hypothetical protein HPB47_006741 [Ixodes persulcatus]|uniref:Uncharacterized protein n=1 Tax=Ixodes persulcatus TaxID=34615 RepID=A0AC60P9G8_IXOPE|nr:hypothetical protein HPB47_006741 [Ixodes persulcatus]